MIKKYLICSKQLYLANKKPGEFEGEAPPIIEISMPVESYWEVRDLLEQADYLISSNADPITVQEVYKKIYKRVAPWAITEQDRQSLYSKFGQ